MAFPAKRREQRFKEGKAHGLAGEREVWNGLRRAHMAREGCKGRQRLSIQGLQHDGEEYTDFVS